MSQSESEAIQAHGQTSTDLDKRDVRALTERMTVLPEGGDIYTVVSESGAEYRVDTLEGRCTCPDAQHNLPTDDGRELCKHSARVRFATGQWSIPAWVDTDAVDPQIGLHTDETPRVAASDGGVIETPAFDETDESDEERPDNCDCWNPDQGLPCWPCFRAGYETPNPQAGDADD